MFIAGAVCLEVLRLREVSFVWLTYIMPPKRSRLKSPPSDEDSAASTERSSSPSPPVYRNANVATHAALFAELPTDSVLSQIVGVATRLSARITALSHSAVAGDARVYRDCIRVTRSALSFLRPAVCDLAGLEIRLLASLADLTARLDEVNAPVRQRPRR